MSGSTSAGYDDLRNPKREPEHLGWIAVKQGAVIASARDRGALLGWLRRSGERGVIVKRRGADA